MRLKIGEKAPDFELSDETESTVSLSDYHGVWVLLYFYPEDNTTGCTREAEMFRDMHEKFSAKEVVVLGISTDSYESHAKFKEKNNLPFSLLSDEDGEVSELYNVFDKDSERAKRASFLIDSAGVLKKIYSDINPDIHAKEILEDLTVTKEN